MLSLKRHIWLCVLGGEVVYVLCLLSAYVLVTPRAAELHKALFETLPDFTWINPVSIAVGAIYGFVLAWIFGAYIAWMHNTSLSRPERSPEPRASVAPSQTPVLSH